MRYFFGAEGRARLMELFNSRLLVAFDFDGTLAPIVANPEAARLSAATARLLHDLSERVPVALISGRGLSDLRKRMPQSLLDLRKNRFQLIGNHGAEFQGSAVGKRLAQKDRLAAREFERASMAWSRGLFDVVRRTGAVIESKTCSVSVHFRGVKSQARARADIELAIQALKPVPRVVEGKCVYNLVHPSAPHKGQALRRLISELGANRAIFVGDDVTDEDVFRLPEALNGSKVLSVSVGRRRGSCARFYVRGQSEVNRLIRTLVDGF